MKWRMMFVLIVLALASVASAEDRSPRRSLDDCSIEETIRFTGDGTFERTFYLDVDDQGSCGRVQGPDITYEVTFLTAGLYSVRSGADSTPYLFITSECCGGEQFYPRGLVVSQNEIYCMWFDAGTYYITVEGYGEGYVEIYSCDFPCADAPVEGFQYSEGYVTFYETVNANSGEPNYDGPWEMDGPPCQQLSANEENTTVGFGFYNWYNQDYGWTHLFDTEGLECLDYSVDSAVVVICAYENDNCYSPAGPLNEYSECEFDAVLGDNNFLGVLNPNPFEEPGNLSYSSSRINVPLNLLEDGELQIWLDIDAWSDQCAWATTVYSSQLIVYLSCRQIPPGPVGYDLGDLPSEGGDGQPCYHTGSVQEGGPANAVFEPDQQVAWLGECVNHELAPNEVDADGCDDGIYFVPNDRPGGAWYPGDEVCVDVLVSTGPAYQPGTPLYLWGWKDGNMDCDFDDLLEVPGVEFPVSECIISGYPVYDMSANDTREVRLCFTDPGVLNLGRYDGHLRFRLLSCGPDEGPARDVCDCFTAQTYIDEALGETEDFIVNDLQLPVELQSFTANGSEGRVVLSWSTASEQDNDAFEVQRSIENGWQRIGQLVEGAGNSASHRNYVFADTDVEVGQTYHYRLITIDVNGNRMPVGETEAVVEPVNTTVETFSLRQNYPNPFNPTTQITYDLAKATDVRLMVFDLLGREVATLVKAPQAAGRYVVDFDATGLPSGMYFYRLETAQFTDMKKMMLLK